MSPVLLDAIGGDYDAAAQFVALMDQCLQQCAGVVRDGACEEQIVQHEEIAVDDGSQPDLALCLGSSWRSRGRSRRSQDTDLVALQDRRIGNRLGDVGLPEPRLAQYRRCRRGHNEHGPRKACARACSSSRRS